MNKHKSNKIKENSNTVRHLIMGQITTTQNLVQKKSGTPDNNILTISLSCQNNVILCFAYQWKYCYDNISKIYKIAKMLLSKHNPQQKKLEIVDQWSTRIPPPHRRGWQCSKSQGSNFESDIADNRQASAYSHKGHAHEIWNWNSKANLSYAAETMPSRNQNI